MGMDLYVQGKRDIIVVETGMRDVQYTHIFTQHTNTETTKKIIRATDPYSEYLKYLSKRAEYCCEYFKDNTEYYKNQIKDFKALVTEMKKQGYEIIYSEI